MFPFRGGRGGSSPLFMSAVPLDGKVMDPAEYTLNIAAK